LGIVIFLTGLLLQYTFLTPSGILSSEIRLSLQSICSTPSEIVSYSLEFIGIFICNIKGRHSTPSKLELEKSISIYRR
jgi:hypothetical protein